MSYYPGEKIKALEDMCREKHYDSADAADFIRASRAALPVLLKFLRAGLESSWLPIRNAATKALEALP